ncbi:hypothetical protein [Gemmatimonas sp.]
MTAPSAAARRVEWARVRSVAGFEVRAQFREPLTTLYALVFGLLALGFASSDAVELVRNRGAVPRTASWTLLLAFGGLTAFGQVITTMIATTAMLRDEAQRTRALIATSGIRPRTWLLGRLSAALVVMSIVYAAMPLGAVAGTALVGGPVNAALAGSARAFAVITVPTMFVVTVLLASAALYSQRVLGVLVAALALVGVWQVALALVGSPDTATLGALLDPFGNAPVLAVTAGWSETERSLRTVPFHGLIAANRLLWCGVSAGVLLLTVSGGSSRAFVPLAHGLPNARTVAGTRAIANASSALASVRHFTATWMQHDGGWRIVAALAVLNACANAIARPLSTADWPPFATALLLVSEHARVFLILLATVYAGELLWRERDVRVHALVDALPVSRHTYVAGRVQGLLMAQRAVVLPLAAAALGIALARAGRWGAWQEHGALWLAWTVFVLWLPFAQLTLLSLTVHVLLDRKVAAHLVLITGWVVAVVLDSQGTTPWWLRFAEAAPLLHGGDVNWGALMQRGAYWSTVSAALLLLCWWRWPQGANARGT